MSEQEKPCARCGHSSGKHDRLNICQQCDCIHYCSPDTPDAAAGWDEERHLLLAVLEAARVTSVRLRPFRGSLGDAIAAYDAWAEKQGK